MIWFNLTPDFNIDIFSPNLGPCGNEIVNRVLGLNNSVLKTIKDFFSESTKFNINFEVDATLSSAASAVPSPFFETRENNYGKFTKLNVTIKINPNSLNGSTKMSIAADIIHELIHAYFFYRQNDAFGDYEKEQLLNSELGFLKTFDPNADPAVYGSNNQHEQMAVSFVNKIALMLKEFYLINDTDLAEMRNIYPRLTIDEYYKAMAWGGLTETNAWQTFKNTYPQKEPMYLFILSSEDYGTSAVPSKIKC